MMICTLKISLPVKSGDDMKRLLLSLLFLVCLLTSLQTELLQRSQVWILQTDINESEAFRRQALNPDTMEALRKESQGDMERFAELLTNAMLRSRFSEEKMDGSLVFPEEELYRKYKDAAYQSLLESYQAIWADLVYFPVAAADTSFADTWGEPRTYGGDRLHEGTDIFGAQDVSGYYPIVSMTEGVVEQVGWLPLGGYRIGIRSPHGGYFYYCHLSSYDREFQRGDLVAAGEILGFMGNTGYGEEGTRGKFPVHLHLGIYIATSGNPELSVNPYWILRTMEEQRIVFAEG